MLVEYPRDVVIVGGFGYCPFIRDITKAIGLTSVPSDRGPKFHMEVECASILKPQKDPYWLRDRTGRRKRY